MFHGFNRSSSSRRIRLFRNWFDSTDSCGGHLYGRIESRRDSQAVVTSGNGEVAEHDDIAHDHFATGEAPILLVTRPLCSHHPYRHELYRLAWEEPPANNEIDRFAAGKWKA